MLVEPEALLSFCTVDRNRSAVAGLLCAIDVEIDGLPREWAGRVLPIRRCYVDGRRPRVGNDVRGALRCLFLFLCCGEGSGGQQWIGGKQQPRFEALELDVPARRRACMLVGARPEQSERALKRPRQGRGLRRKITRFHTPVSKALEHLGRRSSSARQRGGLTALWPATAESGQAP